MGPVRYVGFAPLLILAACAASTTERAQAPATGTTGQPEYSESTTEPAAPVVYEDPVPAVETLPTVAFTGDDMVITSSVRVEPGVYHVTDTAGDGVIQVLGAGVQVDLRGVELVGHTEGASPDPDALVGIGVHVSEAPGAHVHGGSIRGFKIGVRVIASADAVVESTDASGNFRQRLLSTPQAENPADWLRPHDNDDGEWEWKYGGGISITDSPRTTVRDCTVRRGQNGVIIARSDGAQVYDNDFSFNSGWGIALYRTSDATVSRNRADWCVRGYSHGVYDRGQDSAGILVFEQCSRNVFALNSATHCGDGFFLYAGEETLHQTGAGGCNDNLVWRNDFSHSVANAIEATFSRGNVFAENVLDDSRHGVWAGYSQKSLVCANTIQNCDHGVSIEHGAGNHVTRNVIVNSGRVGVQLWSDEDAELAATQFGQSQDTRSWDNAISHNHFVDNALDIQMRDDQNSLVIENHFRGAAPKIEYRGDATYALLARNESQDTPLVVLLNHDAGKVFEAVPEGRTPVSTEGAGDFDLRSTGGYLNPPWHDAIPGDEYESELPGKLVPWLPEGTSRGRSQIRVDAWGPVEPGTR